VSIPEAHCVPPYYSIAPWSCQLLNSLVAPVTCSHPRVLVGRSQGGLSRSGLCVSPYSDRLLAHLRFGLGGRFDTRLLSITERSLLGSSETLVYGRISITLYILCDWCTTSPLSWTFAQFVPHIFFERTIGFNEPRRYGNGVERIRIPTAGVTNLQVIAIPVEKGNRSSALCGNVGRMYGKYALGE
jgi:hypothetical protein